MELGNELWTELLKVMPDAAEAGTHVDAASERTDRTSNILARNLTFRSEKRLIFLFQR
jgi:hypothetical protein